MAGLTAVLTEDSGALEFDGLWVETGPLDPEGLTPAAALPALVETARTGYITACRLEEDGLLRVDCGDPEADPRHRDGDRPVVPAGQPSAPAGRDQPGGLSDRPV